MVFGLFRKKPPAPPDPLAAFDAFIEALERQAAQVRRSAATLLALRGELSRSADKAQARLGEIARRLAEAQKRQDARAEQVLERDRAEAQRSIAASEEALARAAADAGLLLAAAEDLGRQLSDLQSERASAHARLAAGQVVSAALRQRSAEIAQVLALDEARDEVERAHALAEIYREEGGAASTSSAPSGAARGRSRRP